MSTPELFEVLRRKRPEPGATTRNGVRRGAGTTTGRGRAIGTPPVTEEGWLACEDGTPMIVSENGDALAAVLEALGIEMPAPEAAGRTATGKPEASPEVAARTASCGAKTAPTGRGRAKAVADLARKVAPDDGGADDAAPTDDSGDDSTDGSIGAQTAGRIAVRMLGRAKETAASIAGKILTKADDRGLVPRRAQDLGKSDEVASAADRSQRAAEAKASERKKKVEAARRRPSDPSPDRTGVFPRVAVRADTAAAASAAALFLLAVAFLGGRATAITAPSTSPETLLPVGPAVVDDGGATEVAAAPAGGDGGAAPAPAEPTPRRAAASAAAGEATAPAPAPTPESGAPALPYHIAVCYTPQRADDVVRFLKTVPEIAAAGLVVHQRRGQVFVGHFASEEACGEMMAFLKALRFEGRRDFPEPAAWRVKSR